jgi:hypothetical protein
MQGSGVAAEMSGVVSEEDALSTGLIDVIRLARLYSWR